MVDGDGEVRGVGSWKRDEDEEEEKEEEGMGEEGGKEERRHDAMMKGGRERGRSELNWRKRAMVVGRQLSSDIR